jgi:RND superfamily putative drug exporter
MSRTTRTAGGVAGRAGQWSARHPWRAIVLWLVFVIGATLVGASVGTKQLSTAEQLVGESAEAQRLLDRAGYIAPAAEFVLVQAVDGPNKGRQFDGVLADVAAAVEGTGRVTDVASPLVPGAEGMRSADGRSALVTFSMKGDAKEAAEHVEQVEAAVDKVAAAHPELLVEQFGDASSARELQETLGEDFERAHTLSIPLSLGILLITFGAVVAAVLPVALALTAFAAALGLLGLTSQLWAVDQSSTVVMLLIGLAVGVDYSLFYLSRERSERRRGLSAQDALAVASATSGRAVLVSGITVMLALAGMFLTGIGTFVGMAQAAILVVGTAVIGSLTVLPATMALLGDRVERLRLPLLHRLRRDTEDSRVWTSVVNAALRRPALAAIGSATLLGVLAIPALDLTTSTPGADDLPSNNPVVQAYDRLQDAFPGGPAPANVVITGDVESPELLAAVKELQTVAVESGAALEPVSVTVDEAKDLVLVDLPLPGAGDRAAEQDAVEVLREDVVPQTVGAVDGVEVAVTGSAASSMDFTAAMSERGPWVVAFVLVLAFGLLLASFRSVVVAVKAIVLNLLSVAAAYGVMVATFQWGWGESLLNFESTGAIAAWLPLFLFVILFGLSMDYHVFILSRVRELRDGGASTPEAIRRGITSTAGVVSSAAIIMVAVFSIFATLSQVSMKQLGVGLAVAVLLDATLVRGVLLPSTMRLLGEANWYLPRWLAWLPRIDHGGAAAPLPEAAHGPGAEPGTGRPLESVGS